MKNKFLKSFFLFFFSLFLISSCKKNKAVLDVSVFQSITPTEQWAVVVDSYVSFYADSSKKASVHNNLYVIQDLGSVNRTYVNGQEINGRQYLQSGDIINIGTVSFQFGR